MWIWVVAIVVLLLIWGGALLANALGLGVAVPPTLQLWVTLSTVLLVAGVLLWRYWRARLRAQALEREILRQSESQAANAKPERRAEILQLQRQIAQGIQALKGTKLGARYGRGALYALPWYAIIGPTGAGKTTAIKHSGLNFPFSDPRGAGSLRGVGGTRNCDWWFTNEAILLDTAGRYATMEDDRDEWLSFLDLLKKYRPKKPLNGLLVAISVEDLAKANDEQIYDYATKLRARIDEIMTRLQIVLPVYVVFTKVDLIAGFVEFWDNLTRRERDQVFGASLALTTGTSSDPAKQFNSEFDRLVSALHGRALRIISEQRRPAARARIFQFPIELKALRSNLEELVRVLFEENAFQESPVFRGFYFTSGIQEGKPIDRVISGMARAFGLRAAQSEPPSLEPKSYFVTDLFKKVIFPDQRFAGSTESAIRAYKRTRLMTGAGLSLLGIALAAPAVLAYENNAELARTSRALAAAADFRTTGTATQLNRIEELRRRVKQLDDWHARGAPLGYRWGMYVGDSIRPALLDAWARHIDRYAIRSVRNNILRNLAALTSRDKLTDSFQWTFDGLKLYLMMGTPERIDVTWASERLLDRWLREEHTAEEAKATAGNLQRYFHDVMQQREAEKCTDAARHEREEPAADDAKKLMSNVDYYFDLMKRGQLKSRPQDKVVVGQARTPLKAALHEYLLKTLESAGNAHAGKVSYEQIFAPGSMIAQYVTSKSKQEIDGAYTKDGWERCVKRLLNQEHDNLNADVWVFGQDATDEIETEVESVKDDYFELFAKKWRDFIDDLVIQQPDSASEALAELQALSEPVWPYKRLLEKLRDNVTLDLGPEPQGKLKSLGQKIALGAASALEKRVHGIGDAGAALNEPAVPKSKVEEKFQPMIDLLKSENNTAGGLSRYQQVLTTLVGVLTELRDSADIDVKHKSWGTRKVTTLPPEELAKIGSEYQKAVRAVRELLTDSQTGYTLPLISPIFLDPITWSWAAIVSDNSGAAGATWETTVWKKWHETLQGKYPFVDGPVDANIEEFTEFFRPGTGLLWSFYDQNLSGSLRRVGDNFVASKRFGSNASFADEFLTNCLERGAKITRAVFDSKAEQPAMGFRVNLHAVSKDVSAVGLEIDGVAKTYTNAPEEWFAFTWPATEPKSRGAKVQVKGYRGLDEQIVREGDFGFFRLIDAAEPAESGTAGGKPGALPTTVLTWKLRSQDAFLKLDIRPSKSSSRPETALFHDYNCPRVIAASAVD